MAHNRKLVLGGVSLTKERPNNFSISVMSEIRDELELIIIETNFIEKAPFNWIGIIFRYGLVNANKPKYQKINSKHCDLPVTMELDTQDLSKANKFELKKIFRKATLLIMIDVADKFNLESGVFEELLHEITTQKE